MFGFLIKKAFFDFWDNMGRMLVQNFVMMALVMVFFFSPRLLGDRADLIFITWMVLLVVYTLYEGVLYRLAVSLADNRSEDQISPLQALKAMVLPSLGYGLIRGLMVVSLVVGVRFYLSLDTVFGVVAATILFWMMLILLCALQFFYPVYNRLSQKFFPALKKSLIIFLDNPFHSFLILLWGLLLTVISFFLMFFMPGPSGVSLWFDEAVRMLIKKYDYLDENPDVPSRKVPWRMVTHPDREQMGGRSIKNTIFPWK